MATEVEDIVLDDIRRLYESTEPPDSPDERVYAASVGSEISVLPQILNVSSPSAENEPKTESEEGRESTNKTAEQHANDADEQPSTKWKFGTQLRKKLQTKELGLALVAITTLIFTVLALWPSIASLEETDIATQLAEWEAQKDFLEFCSSTPNASIFNTDCALTTNFSLPAPPHFLDHIGSVVRRHIQAAIYLSPDYHELEPFESKTDIIPTTLFAVSILVASIAFPYLARKLAQGYSSSMSPEIHVPTSVPKVSDSAFILSLDCLCRCCDHRPRNENPGDDMPVAPFWKTFRKYADSETQTVEVIELLEQARAEGIAQRKARAQPANEAQRIKAARARLAQEARRRTTSVRIISEQRYRFYRLKELLSQMSPHTGGVNTAATEFEMQQLIDAIEYNMVAAEEALL